MFSNIKNKYPELLFIAKFLLLFSLLFFGTEFWIGITSPGNYYSPFCSKYLNYIDLLRNSLLKAANVLCNILGYSTTVISKTTIMGFNGYKATIIYSCIGYGILSFWTAFVISYPSSFKQKIKWLLCGSLLLWFINVVRISLLLIYINKVKSITTFPKHHLVYNIIAYTVVFFMIYLFSRNKSQLIHK